MFFTLREIVKWLGMTVFEIWINLLTLLIFSVLAVLKYEGIFTSTSWWTVFTPLFVGDGLNTYFCIIVFIRQYQESFRTAVLLRLLSSLLCFCLLFVFKFLLCQKLSYSDHLTHMEVIAPLFPLMVIMSIRSCQASTPH